MGELKSDKLDDEISIKELISNVKAWLTYLLSKWRVLVLSVIVGGCLGLAYAIIKKPIYKATFSFALEDDKSSGGLGGALGLASSFGLDVAGGGGSIFTGSNLTELFKSRSMVEKTLLSAVYIDGKKKSLAEMYIQYKGWRDTWREDVVLEKIQFVPDSDRAKFTRVQDSILGSIYIELAKNSLYVGQKDKKIAIIDIDFSSSNELFSKLFAEGLVKEVSNFYVNAKSKKSRENMLILEHQTDSIRRELNGAIMGVAVANDNTFNLNPALNVKRAPSSRRQVDVQANSAILTELVKQTELAKVTLRKETPLIQIIDKPILPLAKEELSKVKGITFGVFISVFLTIIGLLLKRFLIKLN